MFYLCIWSIWYLIICTENMGYRFIIFLKIGPEVQATLKRQFWKWWVAGSIPGGDIYIFFNLFLSVASLSVQLGGANANEIKHEHSPVVYVV